MKQTPPPSSHTQRPWMQLALLVPALAIYTGLCLQSRFTQDDAYITFRYIANALDGHGLVYNIGERLEGFTNFGWLIILLALVKLGLELVTAAAALGYLCGAAVIVMTWQIARVALADHPRWLALLPVYLMAVNGALAYWSPAGLETSAFALAVVLSLYFFLTPNWLLVASLIWAVLLRPEGAVVAALLIIIEMVTSRRLPRFSLSCAALALVLTVPLVAFRLAYFGSLVPNPFFAKTSFDLVQLGHGLNYTSEFLRHYGFLGLGLIVSLFMYGRLTLPQRVLLLFTLGYTVYVTVVGGDVLKVHRFFVPVMGASACLAILAVALVARPLSKRAGAIVTFTAGVVLFALTWLVPRQSIDVFLRSERSLVTKMQLIGENLRKQDRGAFSVASSTIGALGYSLVGHRVIDMLGLTDSTIARHPQDEIPSLAGTWKERNFNADYVLRQAPEYIVFATGPKPSSPADQALFLYTDFLQAYRIFTVTYISPQNANALPTPIGAYRRVRQLSEPITPDVSPEFVVQYRAALELANASRDTDALNQFAVAERELNGYLYPELMYQQAYSLITLGLHDEAYAAMNRILQIDSLTIGPHRDLYTTESFIGDHAKAAIHRAFLSRYSPSDLSAADEHIARILRSGAADSPGGRP